jgi:hypothetical protein
VDNHRQHDGGTPKLSQVRVVACCVSTDPVSGHAAQSIYPGMLAFGAYLGLLIGGPSAPCINSARTFMVTYPLVIRYLMSHIVHGGTW